MMEWSELSRAIYVCERPDHIVGASGDVMLDAAQVGTILESCVCLLNVADPKGRATCALEELLRNGSAFLVNESSEILWVFRDE